MECSVEVDCYHLLIKWGYIIESELKNKLQSGRLVAAKTRGYYGILRVNAAPSYSVVLLSSLALYDCSTIYLLGFNDQILLIIRKMHCYLHF